MSGRPLGFRIVSAALAAGALMQASACAPALPEAAQCVGMAPVAGERDGMVWIPGGAVTMGESPGHPEERPNYQAQVAGFWLDRHEVTNAQFAAFVQATGYVTEAERQPPEKGGPGSAVFTNSGWAYVGGASWRRPYGPGSGIEGLEDHPVVHVTYADASAYAQWAGRVLPTEEQYEYAARLGRDSAFAAGAQGRARYRANTWQGVFPFRNSGEDGFLGTAPAACFEADELGLHDILGNVWEWTSTPYYPRHQPPADLVARFPDGLNPTDASTGARVIKGGSYLCADNFCARYTPSARQPQEPDLGASHIGFRTALNAPGPS